MDVNVLLLTLLIISVYFSHADCWEPSKSIFNAKVCWVCAKYIARKYAEPQEEGADLFVICGMSVPTGHMRVNNCSHHSLHLSVMVQCNREHVNHQHEEHFCWFLTLFPPPQLQYIFACRDLRFLEHCISTAECSVHATVTRYIDLCWIDALESLVQCHECHHGTKSIFQQGTEFFCGWEQ